MCYLHYASDSYEDPEPDQVPRSYPRVAWAIPVDAALLGASLEAWTELSPAIQMVRLCHRFSDSMLRNLPQEVLDLIIAEMYKSNRADLAHRWESRFTCFQGQCTLASHYLCSDDEVNNLWYGLCANASPPSSSPLQSDNTSTLTQNTSPSADQQRREQVENFINEDFDFAYDSICDAHFEAVTRWVEMFCLCKREPPARHIGSFRPLQLAFKSQFGLETMILHEAFSERMRSTLPETRSCAQTAYFTSCFLVLPNEVNKATKPDKHTDVSVNGPFLLHDDHLAFHQTIDLASYSISEKQRSLFSRALRVLDLQPTFHLTELQSRVLSPIENEDWQAHGLCEQSPIQSSRSRRVVESRKQRLQRYIQQEDLRLQKQQWPQLKLLAAADVVVPHH